MKVYKYGDNVDTDVIIPARYLNAPDESPWPPTVWRTSTPASPPRWSRATSSWPGPTSAAAPPGSTPLWPSRPAASSASSRPPSPASSTATPSTSAFPFWSVCRGGGGHSGRRHGERGLRYRRDHRRDHRQDLSGRALPAFVQGIVDNGGLLKSLKARGAAK